MSDESLVKPCRICKDVKPLTDFPRRSDTKDHHRSVCKDCGRKYRRVYDKENPEIKRASYKRWIEKKGDRAAYFRQRAIEQQFGISYGDYLALLEKQCGVCAICGKPETVTYQNGRIRTLAIDHDHTTGKIRGLLCFRCNTGLVYVEDEAFISMAQAYLA